MITAAKETIGFARKKNQDRFDENEETVSRLIETKLWTRITLENHATAENKRKHQQASAECQRGIRIDQNIWWQRKAKEMQNYMDQRDLRCFYAATKEIISPTRSPMGSLKSAAGSTITKIQGILESWKSHFENLLNDHSRTPDDLLQITPQLPICRWMSLPPSPQGIRANEAWKRSGTR
ncbi:Hypothetical predicted protein [Octopus vulgaris]|uniref:Uncharacterized protein n=1 Tax=Octopus vulgaris TaxID=6645 RepID=A0AA36BCK0_OCTVU|nr:Hypothetical predicted protein [Octopus vulgaris]